MGKKNKIDKREIYPVVMMGCLFVIIHILANIINSYLIDNRPSKHDFALL